MAKFATPKLIKELRELSGAGMLDCKKALENCEGDIEKSISLLRESGLAKAVKKSGNVAAEGLISIIVNNDEAKAVIAEINSQTDFVAKNDNFKSLVKEITNHIYDTGVNSTEELNKTIVHDTNFETYLNSKIATIGENIVARNMTNIACDNGVINGYVHTNGRVGVIIAATCDENVKEKTKELLKSLSMHAAAMKPSVISYKDFDKKFVESENKAIIADIEKANIELHRLGKPEINIPLFVSKLQLTKEALDNQENAFKEELKTQGKPEKIWNNILPGKMNRFVEDNTKLDLTHALLSQRYVFDDTKTVEQAISDIDSSIKIVEYVKLELGDGIEVEEEDFAAEVASQMEK